MCGTAANWVLYFFPYFLSRGTIFVYNCIFELWILFMKVRPKCGRVQKTCLAAILMVLCFVTLALQHSFLWRYSLYLPFLCLYTFTSHFLLFPYLSNSSFTIRKPFGQNYNSIQPQILSVQKVFQHFLVISFVTLNHTSGMFDKNAICNSLNPILTTFTDHWHISIYSNKEWLPLLTFHWRIYQGMTVCIDFRHANFWLLF